MRIIAITNQKGGVGKTTSAVALATGLIKLGNRVLLIDTDAQCNSTDTYRATVDGKSTLYDLLCENESVLDCIQSTEIGDIISGDPLLMQAESKLPDDNSRSFILREKCKGLDKMYDYVIIDTPPTMGVILSNVLTYAQEIIIPVTCDRYGLQGIDQLSQTIRSAQKYTNPNLKILGMLLIKYNPRFNLCREIEKGLPVVANNLNTSVFSTKIRESEACKKSQSARLSIYEYDAKCTTAQDYASLCNELTRGESNG